ncbi:ThiF family adenylyltransferase [Myxococcus xanthus]|uniref:Thiamine biosynthesis protein ThiF n=1 Tax=Myxococcus xanthus TaxID=34 RepID=A0A7Y4MU74_MYXXA|nr:ThiF family adenylyltransferase [Myxococcus xanthus]NOJ82901.1 hypothetical protein [Myxococcus xanthus]NOJ90183.1 hypothetical protein [Myxococcus xanthus]
MKQVGVDSAVIEGGAALAALGFNVTAQPLTWEGELNIGGSPTPVLVSLPRGFPYDLPVVKVDRTKLGRQIPHVERSGKVCIASSNGLLLDATRPASLVREALLRAQNILFKGLQGENAGDLQQEFSAYWASSAGRTVLTFCDVKGNSREVAIAETAKGRGSIAFVAGESADELRTTAERIGLRIGAVEPAWLIRLKTPVMPPPFEAETNLRYVGTLIRKHLDDASRITVERWLTGGQTRLTFLFSFPINNSHGDAVFAWRLSSSLPSDGFRIGRVPLGIAVGRNGRKRGERLDIQRGDADFLEARTGSSASYRGKRVLIVGCGAVGGYLAMCLADSGIGHLTLVDDDQLRSENAIRHVLGLAHVGRPKVEALRTVIQSRLPHVSLDVHGTRLEEVLDKDPGLARRHDLVALATGDHTFELRMSESLRAESRLIHVWLEAHGIAGHVLADGHPEIGCLGCLFDADDVHGLRCKASFYEPGQDFSAAVGGCAGTFTPFGSLDAQRAGIEAARVTLRILAGELKNSTLVSWFEPNAAPQSAKLALSARARQMSPGGRTEVTQHAGCPRCAR